MIKHFVSLVVSILLTTSFIQAQKKPIKFGKVTQEELEMTHYGEDSSAVAVILCNFGQFDSRSFQFYQTIRIKILKKEGLKWADYVFSGSANVGIKGKTFNLVDGEIVEDKLKSESIFKERVYDDNYRIKVAFPNAKVGSVLDLSISYVGLPQTWYFQYQIPVKYCELWLENSPYIEFSKHHYGFITLSQLGENRWIAKNVPAFKEEPQTNSIENYISKFEFEISAITFPGLYLFLTTKWEDVSRRLMESDYFGYAITTGNLFLNGEASEIEQKTDDPLERMKLAYEYIRESVKWNEENRLFTSTQGLRYIYTQQKGNSSDINLMLVALLRKLGLTAYPGILSTRENGLVPFYPTIDKFNYVIAYVKIGEEEILLDATDNYTPAGMLPVRCLNKNFRIIKDDEHIIYHDLNVPLQDKKDVLLNLKLTEDYNLEGNLTYRRSEYAAHNFRKNYKNYANENDYLEDFEADKSGLKVNSIEVNNLDSIDQAVIDKYEISIRNSITQIGDQFYLNPLLIYQLNENPFKSEKRIYPVDFPYTQSERYTITIVIPEGLEVTEIPKPQRVSIPDDGANMIFQVIQVGNTLQIIYQMNINKTIFTSQEYPYIKEFFNMIVKKHAEPVILKKTSSNE